MADVQLKIYSTVLGYIVQDTINNYVNNYQIIFALFCRASGLLKQWLPFCIMLGIILMIALVVPVTLH